MQDRTEAAIVLLTMAVAFVALVSTTLLSVDLSFIGHVSFLLMWCYSILWAFGIRRLLSARLYRNQALGLGLVAVGWATLNYSFIIPTGILPDVAFTLATLLTYFWIDTSIMAGRKSDALYRNTLHWNELRRALWPVVVGVIAIDYIGFLLNPGSFLIIVYSGISRKPSALALVLLAVTFLAVSVPGSVYVLATAFRSKDQTFRKHLLWFGLFVASFLVFLTAAVATSQPALFGTAYVLGTYCLYRSAKSLAPLNRLPSTR